MRLIAEKLRARELDIFVIDTGRDTAMSEMLRSTEAIGQLANRHRVFVLSRQQSSAVINQNEQFTGRDPMLVLLNSDARVEKRRGSYGVRLCLGGLDVTQASVLLEQLAEAAGSSEKSGDEMIAELSSLSLQAVKCVSLSIASGAKDKS